SMDLTQSKAEKNEKLDEASEVLHQPHSGQLILEEIQYSCHGEMKVGSKKLESMSSAA
ncbi:hypothetical protein KIN20_003161, partial [Parelaphostrongylus tenuis]